MLSAIKLIIEMKAVIQRVSNASIEVNNETVNSIGKGLCVLLGIMYNDTPQDMKYMCVDIKKILNTRLFENENKKWNESVVSKNYEVLVISQFTLCYQFKGNKITFHHAMETQKAKEFYEQFLIELKKSYIEDNVQGCPFGALMQVNIVNDGPVTINVESSCQTTNDAIEKEN